MRRRLAYVPDFPFLYDKLTPWEFIRFTGQMFRMTDGEIEAKAPPLVGCDSRARHVRGGRGSGCGRCSGRQ